MMSDKAERNAVDPASQQGAVGLNDVAASSRVRTWPYVVGGFAVVAMLIGGIGLWAKETEISGAVIARGTVVVDSNVKTVQHPSGGVVGEIRVRNGDRVRAGDLLVRLDETVTRANLQILVKQLDELAVRAARLDAEQIGRRTLLPSPDMQRRHDDPNLAAIIDAERQLFESRRSSLQGKKDQLRERIGQLAREASGLEAQHHAKGIEIDLIRKELESLQDLETRKLVTTAKMLSLRREAARLEGEHAQLIAATAQTKGKIAETEVAILNIDEQFRTEVIQDLRDVQARTAELAERRVAAHDKLARIDIRAPVDGIVHELTVNTVGGVIAAGEPLMLIVPGDDELALEARIAPQDRDQVRVDATALIRFPAFNQRTTPEIEGYVAQIAADLTEDKHTGQPFYKVRLRLPARSLEKLGQEKLVSGMPADVYIRTSARTALSYLVKPIEDQFTKAFKER